MLEFQHCALADWAQGLCGRKYDRISTKVQEGSCLGEGNENWELGKMMQRTRDVHVRGVLMFVRVMPASSLHDGPSEHQQRVSVG